MKASGKGEDEVFGFMGLDSGSSKMCQVPSGKCQGLSRVVIEGCQGPTLAGARDGLQIGGLFLRSSSPRALALASFAAILGQELWESQAKNAAVDRQECLSPCQIDQFEVF